jgi:phage shock protein PspC (stress-responsive transcriptional regulator)
MVSQATVSRRLERPRLRRRTEHRLVAGVAGGIADSLNAPVAFVRVIVALAAIVAPWTVWGYAGAALLLPAADRNRPDWDNLIAAGRLTLLWLPGLLLPGELFINEPFEGSPGLYTALYGLLAAGAVALLSADYRRGRPRSPGEARSTVLAALPVAACAVLLCAGMLLAHDVRWERYVPLAVAVGGAAMLAAPRRRELAVPAMLALGVAAVTLASGARLEGGLGDARMTPAGAAGEPVVARRAVGDLTVDLRRLRNSAEPVSLVASVGIGDLSVAVPNNARVRVEARVGLGSFEGFGPDASRVQGFDTRVVRTYRRFRRDRPAGVPVRVVADVGVGNIEVRAGRDALNGFTGGS